MPSYNPGPVGNTGIAGDPQLMRHGEDLYQRMLRLKDARQMAIQRNGGQGREQLYRRIQALQARMNAGDMTPDNYRPDYINRYPHRPEPQLQGGPLEPYTPRTPNDAPKPPNPNPTGPVYEAPVAPAATPPPTAGLGASTGPTYNPTDLGGLNDLSSNRAGSPKRVWVTVER